MRSKRTLAVVLAAALGAAALGLAGPAGGGVAATATIAAVPPAVVAGQSATVTGTCPTGAGDLKVEVSLVDSADLATAEVVAGPVIIDANDTTGVYGPSPFTVPAGTPLGAYFLVGLCYVDLGEGRSTTGLTNTFPLAVIAAPAVTTAGTTPSTSPSRAGGFGDLGAAVPVEAVPRFTG